MELEGQLPLFETGDVVSVRTFRAAKCVDRREWIDWIAWNDGEQPCEECGTVCTSSKECTEISGLYD